MRSGVFAVLAFLAAFLAAGQVMGFEARIDPEADRIFKSMCAYLSSLEAYSVKETIQADKVFPNGQAVEFQRVAEVTVKRPDKLRVEANGDENQVLLVINGTSFLLHRPGENTYGELEIPAGLDASVDFIIDRIGLDAPGSDLLKDDPYKAVMPNVFEASYVGKSVVNGVACRHLAFRQPEVDWQVWVREGDKPLPMRLVITDKTLHGNPQHAFEFTDWKAPTHPADKLFAVTPPKGAVKVELLVAPGGEGANN